MAFGVKDDAGQDWQWMQVFRAGFGVTGITMHTPLTVGANLNGSFITSAAAGMALTMGSNLLYGGNVEADIINWSYGRHCEVAAAALPSTTSWAARR